VLSESADVLYKTTDYYAPNEERCVLWSDPTLAISWPMTENIRLSKKDLLGKKLSEVELFP
jgi:dTDP-4-dehydrorhamnose 3,5-epimerase